MSDEKKSAAKPKFLIKTKKFMTNRLLNRKQFIIEIEHPGRGNVPKREIREKLAHMYKVKDPNTIVVHGFHQAYGGGSSTGFGVVYDDAASCRQIEPRHRLVKLGLSKKREGARKQRKEKKNRSKKFRGTKKSKPQTGKVSKK